MYITWYSSSHQGNCNKSELSFNLKYTSAVNCSNVECPFTTDDNWRVGDWSKWHNWYNSLSTLGVVSKFFISHAFLPTAKKQSCWFKLVGFTGGRWRCPLFGFRCPVSWSSYYYFGSAYTKIETIQRRLAWPLRHEAVPLPCGRCITYFSIYVISIFQDTKVRTSRYWTVYFIGL